jgi:poly-beta-1,6-N-acetyl-D-glucosamine synthase
LRIVPAGRLAPRLLVISPCRDEIAFAERTFESLAAQTVRPDLWVIVDDGSTDGTSELLCKLARTVDWVRVTTVPDRAARDVGPGVINAFYQGLSGLDLEAYDFVCKLDVDLVLPPGYFEACLKAFADDARLGSFSGKVFYCDANGAEVSEGIGDDVSVGAMKMYRMAAFRQIGGLVRAVMWDGIDCHRLRMMGWKVHSRTGDSLAVQHLRPMGSSGPGIIAGRARWGRGQYYMGTRPTWIVVSGAYRMLRPPIVVGGLAIVYGYARAAVSRAPRLEDESFRAFLRRYQGLCMTKGKRGAVELTEAEGARRWDPDQLGLWGDPVRGIDTIGTP